MSELTPHEIHGMQPVLSVHDVESALAFYRDVLGFHVDFVAGDPPEHARVCADPTYASPTVHIRFEPARGGAADPSAISLWLHVANGIDELFERYRARGVTIVAGPEDKPWGLRMFSIKDQDGYVLHYCAEISTA